MEQQNINPCTLMHCPIIYVATQSLIHTQYIVKQTMSTTTYNYTTLYLNQLQINETFLL